jgi:hypothetical protein
VVGLFGRGRVFPKVAEIDAATRGSLYAHFQWYDRSFGSEWFVFANTTFSKNPNLHIRSTKQVRNSNSAMSAAGNATKWSRLMHPNT